MSSVVGSELLNDLIVVPAVLARELDGLGLNRRRYDRSCLIFKRILKSLKRRNFFPGCFVQVPCNYWKKSIGEHYGRVMSNLVDHGLIEVDNRYSNFEGRIFCKSYRISPTFMKGPLESIEFKNSKEGFKIKGRKSTARNPWVYIKNTTLRLLHNYVTIDGEQARSALSDYLQREEYLISMKLNGSVSSKIGIPVNYSALLPSLTEYVTSTTEKAKGHAVKNGMDLIAIDRKYYVDYLPEFKKKKSLQIEISYLESILKIENKKYYFKIGKKSGRVFTNLTALPSRLLPYVKINNERISTIDLKNSHFVILANLFEKGFFHEYLVENYFIKDNIVDHTSNLQISNSVKYECDTTQFLNRGFECDTTGSVQINSRSNNRLPDDIVKFIELARKGKFYEEIQKLLFLNSRAEAKSMVFELFYSSHKFKNDNKVKLSVNFPHFVRVIDEYKKKNGDKMFSILLQRKEKELFIDKILISLLRAGFHVFTKHDSILFPRSEKEKIKELVTAILDKELGTYQILEEIL